MYTVDISFNGHSQEYDTNNKKPSTVLVITKYFSDIELVPKTNNLWEEEVPIYMY